MRELFLFTDPLLLFFIHYHQRLRLMCHYKHLFLICCHRYLLLLFLISAAKSLLAVIRYPQIRILEEQTDTTLSFLHI